jgi:HK97 family phage portal protein
MRFSRGNERSIITSVFNKIAIDVAAIPIKHVRVDEEGRFSEEIKSELDNCLNLEANIDQTSRDFKQDLVQSLLEEGSICAVPVETSLDPRNTDSYQINTMRVGKIVQWYPQHVKVDLYNDQNGKHQEVTLPKKMVAIIENPLYSVMNEPNSTLQRLIRKLALLDVVDEQSSSGKLDLIIQLPYVVKSQTRKNQAEERRKQIETQLTGSKYGIAYTDGTERITQLNRPVENNLLKQVEFLTAMLYGQLGITEEVLKGTADEKTMLNYYNRTIEPILSAISLEFKRKFLTKTARSQGQSIEFYRDPFRLVPVNDMAEIADKFTRNEIMTSNEIRQVIGMKPSDDPKADELNNSNLYSDPSASMPAGEEPPMAPPLDEEPIEDEDPSSIPISEIMN